MRHVGEGPGEGLWLRHAAVGLLTTWVTAGFVLGYAQRPGAVPDRAVLTALAVTGLVGSAGFWFAAREGVRRRRQLPVFALWSLTSMSLVLVGVHVDGGYQSPLQPVLFVVLVFPAFAYPWRYVLGLGLFELTGVGLVLSEDGSAGAAQKAFLLVGLGLTLGMVSFAAYNRGRQEVALDQLRVRLEEQAVEDPLTGCLNRRGFDRALAAEAARGSRYAFPWALLMLDIDRLKALNDSAGHAAGDAAIQRVAHAMRDVARRTDVVARLGGDEFAMLLPETTLTEGRRLAERLRRRLNLVGDGLPVTVSLGLAESTAAGPGDAEGVLRAADAALYQAKLSGRDRLAEAPSLSREDRVAVPSQRA